MVSNLNIGEFKSLNKSPEESKELEKNCYYRSIHTFQETLISESITSNK